MVELSPTSSNPHVLCLYAALTCPSEEDWIDLMVEVLIRKASGLEGPPDGMWDTILEHMAANVPEA